MGRSVGANKAGIMRKWGLGIGIVLAVGLLLGCESSTPLTSPLGTPARTAYPPAQGVDAVRQEAGLPPRFPENPTARLVTPTPESPFLDTDRELYSALAESRIRTAELEVQMTAVAADREAAAWEAQRAGWTATAEWHAYWDAQTATAVAGGWTATAEWRATAAALDVGGTATAQASDRLIAEAQATAIISAARRADLAAVATATAVAETAAVQRRQTQLSEVTRLFFFVLLVTFSLLLGLGLIPALFTRRLPDGTVIMPAWIMRIFGLTTVDPRKSPGPVLSIGGPTMTANAPDVVDADTQALQSQRGDTLRLAELQPPVQKALLRQALHRPGSRGLRGAPSSVEVFTPEQLAQYVNAELLRSAAEEWQRQ